jgi:hypothetical protein
MSTWFYSLDKKFWKNRIETNPYLATTSLIFTACVGAAAMLSALCTDTFHWKPLGNNVIVVGIVVFIWALNVAESIIASASWKVATLRILILTIAFPLMLAVGVVLSLLVLIFIMVYVAIGSVFASGKGKKYTLSDGTVIKEEKGMLGETSYREDGGYRTYEKAQGSDEFYEN